MRLASGPLQIMCRGPAESSWACCGEHRRHFQCTSETALWYWGTGYLCFSDLCAWGGFNIFKLRLKPTWKFLSGFLCTNWCLIYIYFIYVTRFVYIPVIDPVKSMHCDWLIFLLSLLICRIPLYLFAPFQFVCLRIKVICFIKFLIIWHLLIASLRCSLTCFPVLLFPVNL